MRLSINLDPPLLEFLTHYQARVGAKSRSAVVEHALRLLANQIEEADLAAAYAASAGQDRSFAVRARSTDNDGLAFARPHVKPSTPRKPKPPPP